MTGRSARLVDIEGRTVAALLRRGRVEDLLVEATGDDGPQPGEIWRGRLDRILPGGAGFLATEAGALFLSDVGELRAGDMTLARVLTSADPSSGKAPRATRKIELAGRFVTATPGAPGINASRKIADPDRRAALVAAVSARAAALCPGFVIRTAAATASIDAVAQEAAALGAAAARLTPFQADGLGRVLEGPGLVARARALWSLEQDPVAAAGDDTARILRAITEARGRSVALAGGARILIDTTAGAHVIDVDAGAGEQAAANAAAADAIPRALRVRGLAGAVLVDFVGDPGADREGLAGRVARAADAALELLGWGPLGLLELRRRADRPPLSRSLPRAADAED